MVTEAQDQLRRAGGLGIDERHIHVLGVCSLVVIDHGVPPRSPEMRERRPESPRIAIEDNREVEGLDGHLCGPLEPVVRALQELVSVGQAFVRDDLDPAGRPSSCDSTGHGHNGPDGVAVQVERPDEEQGPGFSERAGQAVNHENLRRITLSYIGRIANSKIPAAPRLLHPSRGRSN